MGKSATAPKMANLTSKKKGAVKKSAAKSTAKAAPAKTDWLSTTSTEVENLTKAKAMKMAPELIESEGMNDFKLGGVLQRIQEESWWEGGDFESFKDYIEQGLGLMYRKCMYLVNIYSRLVACGIPYAKVENIGWSKLRFIVDYLDEDNIDEWVKRCNEMNALEIQEYIKTLKSGASEGGKNDGKSTTTSVKALTFKVHEDQRETINAAVEKGKEEFKTEHSAVAIENICIKYLEGNLGKAKAKKTPLNAAEVKKFLGKMEADDAAALVIEIHPSLQADDEEEDGEEAA